MINPKIVESFPLGLRQQTPRLASVALKCPGCDASNIRFDDGGSKRGRIIKDCRCSACGLRFKRLSALGTKVGIALFLLALLALLAL